MTDPRIEAAAKAYTLHQFDATNDRVSAVLAAADAVMFSEEAIERAAAALVFSAPHIGVQYSDLPEHRKEAWRMRARAMIAALKGASHV